MTLQAEGGAGRGSWDAELHEQALDMERDIIRLKKCLPTHTNKRRGRVGASGLPNTSSSRGSAGTAAGKARTGPCSCSASTGDTHGMSHTGPGLCSSLPAQHQLLFQNDSHCLLTKACHPFVLPQGPVVSLLGCSDCSAMVLEGKVGEFGQFLLPEAIDSSHRMACLLRFLITFSLQHLVLLHSNNHCWGHLFIKKSSGFAAIFASGESCNFCL